MSRSNPARRSNTSAKAQNKPLFELHETPLPSPPRPLRKASNLFDDPPDLRPRANHRVRTATRTAPLDLLVDESDEDPVLRPLPPLAESAVYLEQAHLIASGQRRPITNRGVPFGPPLASSSFTDLLQNHPLICMVVVVIGIGLFLLAFAPQPRTIISRFGGTISAASSPITSATHMLNTPPGEHSLLGAPSITAQQIDAILANYGSPAAGTGQVWVNLGERYGINPAYALAFFIHESSAGTNPAWAGLKPGGGTTHNVGNIICAGYATCFGRFRDYQSWEEGIEDWYQLIAEEYVAGRGVHTIEQIIPIYAPAFENNVPAYVQTVTGMVEQWQREAKSP